MKLFPTLTLFILSGFLLLFSLRRSAARLALARELESVCRTVKEESDFRMSSVRCVLSSVYGCPPEDVRDLLKERFSAVPGGAETVSALFECDLLGYSEKKEKLGALLASSAETLLCETKNEKERRISSVCLYPGMALILALTVF